MSSYKGDQVNLLTKTDIYLARGPTPEASLMSSVLCWTQQESKMSPVTSVIAQNIPDKLSRSWDILDKMQLAEQRNRDDEKSWQLHPMPAYMSTPKPYKN